MVERRAVVERGGGVSLREVNASLQAAIQDYQIALLATIRNNDEQRVAQVLRALEPIDTLRQQLAARARGSSETEANQAALDELVAEQQAVDAEIGYVEGQPDTSAEDAANPPAEAPAP